MRQVEENNNMIILLIALTILALLIVILEVMNYSHTKTMLKYVEALNKVNPRPYKPGDK